MSSNAGSGSGRRNFGNEDDIVLVRSLGGLSGSLGGLCGSLGGLSRSLSGLSRSLSGLSGSLGGLSGSLGGLSGTGDGNSLVYRSYFHLLEGQRITELEGLGIVRILNKLHSLGAGSIVLNLDIEGGDQGVGVALVILFARDIRGITVDEADRLSPCDSIKVHGRTNTVGNLAGAGYILETIREFELHRDGADVLTGSENDRVGDSITRGCFGFVREQFHLRSRSCAYRYGHYQ